MKTANKFISDLDDLKSKTVLFSEEEFRELKDQKVLVLDMDECLLHCEPVTIGMRGGEFMNRGFKSSKIISFKVPTGKLMNVSLFGLIVDSGVFASSCNTVFGGDFEVLQANLVYCFPT